MRIAIHQPNLFPRLKVLQKLAFADVWCVLDSVQYCSREWQNRTRLVAVHSIEDERWLSVPVHRPHGLQTLIRELELQEEPKHLLKRLTRTLLHAYKRSPHWDILDALLQSGEPFSSSRSLVELCVNTTTSLLEIAGRCPQIVYSSHLPVKGKASRLMRVIVDYLQGTTYLADSGARNYLQASDFQGVPVLWQSWKEPEEVWPGIVSWRDLSSLNYLVREGLLQFTKHLESGVFHIDDSFDAGIK